jgi:multiple sugar transport system ATP-binding protein
MTSVKLEGVGKIYEEGGQVAVHAVDLVIAPGEFVVLVGPSGCGKSTTLRMIAGLETISSGKLWIGDRLVNELPPKDRDIAMVFQNYALYPHMTAYENMAFALRLRKLPKAELDRRVRESAAMLGLDDLLDRKPRAMSGGQRQRVALGRALVRNPSVFLFDEPLSNLDAKLRVQMRREIAQLHRRLGTTMIYVTHDQVEAMTLGDRIVVLEAGHVRQVDTPLALYDTPANRFVAGFIGSPAMNFVEGQMRRDEGGRFVSDDGAIELPLPDRPGMQDNRRITLGVRPEHVELAGAVERPGVLQGKVELVEQMGSEGYLHVNVAGHAITARLPHGVAPAIGDTLPLALDTERIHLFDRESGQAV